jgi:hypothetical protein
MDFPTALAVVAAGTLATIGIMFLVLFAGIARLTRRGDDPNVQG